MASREDGRLLVRNVNDMGFDCRAPRRPRGGQPERPFGGPAFERNRDSGAIVRPALGGPPSRPNDCKQRTSSSTSFASSFFAGLTARCPENDWPGDQAKARLAQTQTTRDSGVLFLLQEWFKAERAQIIFVCGHWGHPPSVRFPATDCCLAPRRLRPISFLWSVFWKIFRACRAFATASSTASRAETRPPSWIDTRQAQKPGG